MFAKEALVPSSSDTFGTFLNTYSTLEKQPSSLSRGARRSTDNLMLDIVKSIAAAGAEKPVREIVASYPNEDSAVLSTLLEGQSHGLFQLEESNDESIAKLTTFGKAFSEKR